MKKMQKITCNTMKNAKIKKIEEQLKNEKILAMNKEEPARYQPHHIEDPGGRDSESG